MRLYGMGQRMKSIGKDRYVAMLRDDEGMTLTAIGKILGVTTPMARSRYERYKERLITHPSFYRRTKVTTDIYQDFIREVEK